MLLLIKTKSFIKIVCKGSLKAQGFPASHVLQLSTLRLVTRNSFCLISTQISDTLENNEGCLTCGLEKKGPMILYGFSY